MQIGKEEIKNINGVDQQVGVIFCYNMSNTKQKGESDMKVIFLDIDGVLNCETTQEQTREGVRFVEDKFVERLQRIVDATGARVVLSSDWRYDRDYEECNDDYLELKAKLAECGIEFYGFTPVFYHENRGYEIDRYLKEHKEVEKFVILDDRCDMQPHLERLVRTSFTFGLQDEDVDEAIWLLNSDESDTTIESQRTEKIASWDFW